MHCQTSVVQTSCQSVVSRSPPSISRIAEIHLPSPGGPRLATPEKWDAFSRRWATNNDLNSRLGLFMIDEVHLLASDRGACLEGKPHLDYRHHTLLSFSFPIRSTDLHSSS